MNDVDRFIRVRKHFGKNQGELADILGVNQQSISDIERGRKKIPYEILEKLGKLGVNLNWLICEIGDISENTDNKTSVQENTDNYNVNTDNYNVNTDNFGFLNKEYRERIEFQVKVIENLQKALEEALELNRLFRTGKIIINI